MYVVAYQPDFTCYVWDVNDPDIPQECKKSTPLHIDSLKNLCLDHMIYDKSVHQKELFVYPYLPTDLRDDLEDRDKAVTERPWISQSYINWTLQYRLEYRSGTLFAHMKWGTIQRQHTFTIRK